MRKADSFLASVMKASGKTDPRTINAVKLGLDRVPQMFKDKAEESTNTSLLSKPEWSNLLEDWAALATFWTASEFKGEEVGVGSAWEGNLGVSTGVVKVDGSLLGFTFTQEEAGSLSLVLSDVTVVEGDLPAGTLNRVTQYLLNLLKGTAVAFSFAFFDDKGKRHLWAEYARDEDHVQQKLQVFSPDKSKRDGPVVCSEHKSLFHALTFAFCLNRQQGLSFQGIPPKEVIKNSGIDDTNYESK